LALANNRDLCTAALNIQKAQQQYQISENNQLHQSGRLCAKSALLVIQ
jgi:multidrug efflux system outer membrane protein